MRSAQSTLSHQIIKGMHIQFIKDLGHLKGIKMNFCPCNQVNISNNPTLENKNSKKCGPKEVKVGQGAEGLREVILVLAIKKEADLVLETLGHELILGMLHPR